MVTNQDIAAAFKEAKKILAVDEKQVRQVRALKLNGTHFLEEYICHALEHSNHKAYVSAQHVILSRIDPRVSLAAWVFDNVAENATIADMQAYRHRWIDALITEFESKGIARFFKGLNMPVGDCPFCGFRFPKDLIDNVYPSGICWILEEDGRKHYVRRSDLDKPRKRKFKDSGPCYDVVCQESMGGCGAQISADSREEAIKKWNRRPTTGQPTKGNANV
jgi:hypothetical protein